MASATLLPLRILASFHTLFYAPLHVAHRLGVFAEEGLRARIAFSPQASETADRLLADGGLIRRVASYESLVDNTLAEAALRTLAPPSP